MPMCEIINHLKHRFGPAAVAYDFCESSDSHNMPNDSVAAGLLSRLLQERPAAKELVLSKSQVSDGTIFKTPKGYDALCETLETVLEQSNSQTTWLLVDALDECAHGFQDLIGLFANLMEHNVRIIVSSRYTPEIEDDLLRCAPLDCICLEDNKQEISQAVSSYIGVKVGELANAKRLTGEQSKEITEYLESNANDTFLWVSLVCMGLQNKRVPKCDVLDHIREFPSTLEKLYLRMASIIDGYEPPRKQRLKEILVLASLAYGSISLLDLPKLISPPDCHAGNVDFWREEVQRCGYFLTIEDNMIFFVHRTSQEFVLGQFEQGFLPDSVGAVHKRITTRALAAMLPVLTKDIYDLKKPGIHVDAIEVSKISRLEGLHYACVHWTDHLRDITSSEGGSTDAEVWDEVQTFLKKHFLHWVEAMSLLKASMSAIVSFTKLAAAVEKAFANPAQVYQSDVLSLFRNAVRVLRHFFGCIQDYPIQSYACAPVFTPSQVFKDGLIPFKPPSWMADVPEGRENWGQQLQTVVEDDYVVCSSVSPSGNKFASGDYGGRVHVRELPMGQMAHQYRYSSSEGGSVGDPVLSSGRDRVEVIAFAPVGGLLAFIAGGKPHICDMATNECRKIGTPEDQKRDYHGIKSIAFSEDACRLVAVSAATSSLIEWTSERACLGSWATATMFTRLLGLQPGWIIAISPNARFVAYRESGRNETQIWDTTKRACRMTFLYDTGEAAFSADSAIFAAYTDSATTEAGSGVLVWDVDRNATVPRFVPHPDGDLLFGIAVSNGGKHLALATLAGDIEVSTGKCFWKLQGSSAFVTALHFMDEGKTLVTSQSDRTMRLWDLTVVPDEQMNTGLFPSEVHAISPDCTHLLLREERYQYLTTSSPTGHDELQLRDAFSGGLFNTIETKSKYNTLLVARDGPMMIYTSPWPGVGEVWDMTTGRLQLSLDRSDHQHITISTDGSQIGAIYDGRLQWWDVGRSAMRRAVPPELQGERLRATAYGPRGQVALLTDKGTAKVWKASGGLLSLGEMEDGGVSSERADRAQIAFSPCGGYVAAGHFHYGGSAILKIWHIESGRCVGARTRQQLPIVSSWDASNCEVCNGSACGVATLRKNIDSVEVFVSSNLHEMDLRHYATHAEWACLEEERVLWLPMEWRGERPGRRSGVCRTTGWAGPMVPVYDEDGHYKRIALSDEYLSGQLDDWFCEMTGRKSDTMLAPNGKKRRRGRDASVESFASDSYLSTRLDDWLSGITAYGLSTESSFGRGAKF